MATPSYLESFETPKQRLKKCFAEMMATVRDTAPRPLAMPITPEIRQQMASMIQEFKQFIFRIDQCVKMFFIMTKDEGNTMRYMKQRILLSYTFDFKDPALALVDQPSLNLDTLEQFLVSFRTVVASVMQKVKQNAIRKTVVELEATPQITGPATDSGYASVPHRQYGGEISKVNALTASLVLISPEAQGNERPTMAANENEYADPLNFDLESDYAKTIYTSAGSLPNSDKKNFLSELADTTLCELLTEKPDDPTMERILECLPRLFKAFALKLGYNALRCYVFHPPVPRVSLTTFVGTMSHPSVSMF
jgi:hypothetical protein